MPKRKKGAKTRASRRSVRHLPPTSIGVERGGWKAAPLSTAFMVTSIIGFLVSVVWVRTFSVSWAFAFAVVFFVMFIASMIAMARASPDEQLLPKPMEIK